MGVPMFDDFFNSWITFRALYIIYQKVKIMNRQFQSGTNLNGQGWHDELISQAQIWIDFLKNGEKKCVVCMIGFFFWKKVEMHVKNENKFI